MVLKKMILAVLIAMSVSYDVQGADFDIPGENELTGPPKKRWLARARRQFPDSRPLEEATSLPDVSSQVSEVLRPKKRSLSEMYGQPKTRSIIVLTFEQTIAIQKRNAELLEEETKRVNKANRERRKKLKTSYFFK